MHASGSVMLGRKQFCVVVTDMLTCDIQDRELGLGEGGFIQLLLEPQQ